MPAPLDGCGGVVPAFHPRSHQLRVRRNRRSSPPYLRVGARTRAQHVAVSAAEDKPTLWCAGAGKPLERSSNLEWGNPTTNKREKNLVAAAAAAASARSARPLTLTSGHRQGTSSTKTADVGGGGPAWRDLRAPRARPAAPEIGAAVRRDGSSSALLLRAPRKTKQNRSRK